MRNMIIEIRMKKYEFVRALIRFYVRRFSYIFCTVSLYCEINTWFELRYRF